METPFSPLAALADKLADDPEYLERPRCSVTSCTEAIWWNPRKRRWQHYFEIADHEATE